MSKSLIHLRREAGAICGNCRSPDYREEEPDPEWPTIKPRFICNSCGSSWCYGYDGGKYREFLKKKKEEE